MDSNIYLDHFVEAHRYKFDDALAELEAGEKETHWMWFIFPIAEGLGKSEVAQYYAIGSLNEARAFLAHEVLGENYRKCIKAMLRNRDKSPLAILGKVDKWKFQASVTLFHHVTDDPSLKSQLQECLDHFYDGRRCKSTKRYLSAISG